MADVIPAKNVGTLRLPGVGWVTLVQKASAVWYPAFYSVTASGRNRRPAAARSSASTDHPNGSRADLSGTPDT